MKTYCAFCKTGSENIARQLIDRVNRNVKTIVPVRVLQEKRKGVWIQREYALLPGYVFIYLEDDACTELMTKFLEVYRVLQYGLGFRELAGMDFEYAMWIYRHQGVITTSKVLAEGKEVKVIEGPLLDALGTIIKLDKHKRKVWVEFDFDGQRRVVSLSAECVSAE